MKKTWVFLTLLVFGCTSHTPISSLRLATTTSTYDSGLLDHIIPFFEEQYNVHVDIIAVGTGQALFIAESGDADIILVHAPSKEIEFVNQGFGTARYPVMYNDFVIVGPNDDPANIHNQALAKDALTLISQSDATFISRGDDSGTNIKELSIWAQAGIKPNPDEKWYRSIGQGMGNTLLFANETQAYTLTDRGTYLSLKDSLPNLKISFGGSEITENPDPEMYNYYHVIPVNPDLHDVDYELSLNFVNWLTGLEVQELIEEFGVAEHSQPLFFPNSEAWQAQNK